MVAIITSNSNINTLCKKSIFDSYDHNVRNNATISCQFQLTSKQVLFNVMGCFTNKRS